jgi:dihydrofolate reductase
MLIRTRMAVSLDGFVAGPDGRPAHLAMPDFSPANAYGFPEFLAGVVAVAMGRTTFEPALGAERWPWPGKQVFVLSSSPLPPETPDDVIAVTGGPDALLQQLHDAQLDGDVHVIGGPRTVHALLGAGAIDRLGLLVLPLLFGGGTPLSPAGSSLTRLQLVGHETYPDGVAHMEYTPLG